VAGTDRVLTLDLHAAQIQGFFDIPVDHLYATPVFLDTLKNVKNFSDFVVVSPDVGGVERSRFFARQIGSSIAILDKRRARKNEADVLHLIGSVDGMNVIMIDDMIDTAGTIVKAAEMLRKKKAKSINVYSTHAVLSGPAAERIRDSKIDKIHLTDSIPLEESKKKLIGDKLEILSVSELFGQAIERIHLNLSVSSLFVSENKV
jgi:ribose-phosphate pyrophosphokinase